MKPQEAARLTGIHVNTVRSWTSNDYREFFSVTAQGGDGHTRDLTETDVRVLTFINQLKREGRSSDEVVMALDAAQRRGFDMLPSPNLPETVVPMAVVPRQSAEDALAAERRITYYLEERVEELKEQVNEERRRAELERERSDQLQATTQKRIDDLNKKLGEAERELRLIAEGWRPPTKATGEGK